MVPISTPNLLLTSWVEAHAQLFYELTRDEGFNAHPITIYRQNDLDSARRWVSEAQRQVSETGLGKYAVWERSSGNLIGMGGLTPWKWEGEDLVDLTYRFRESAWGKGFGSEAARQLYEFGRNKWGPMSLTATITPENIGSKIIAQRLGMVLAKIITLKGVTTELYRGA